MIITKTKEDLSISYITALCAYTGIAYEIIRHDDNSTDGLLMKRVTMDNGELFDSQLRIQLKCTSSPSQYTIHENYISYKLKVKNYNDLCLSATTPIILGLLILPENEDHWLRWTTEELLVKGCMYWASFAGNAQSNNTADIWVRIDKNHLINTKTLMDLITKVAKEEDL